jgi:glycosyltransferase involved in cell wall biosynthesis
MVSVGFDIRPLIFTKAGIKTYLYNLVRGLARTGKCRLSLFVSSKSNIEWNSVSENIREELVRLPHINSWCESFWQEFLLPRAVARKGIEVFHGPRFFVPKRLSCPSVVTVHDLAFRKFPGLVLPKTAKTFDGLVSSSVKAANRIIVPSQATKADLQKFYGVAQDKIVIVHEAAEQEFCQCGDQKKIEALKRKLGIRARFILSVGTIEPRKNYSNLLKAYSMLKIQDDLQLVLVGGSGWLYEDVFRTVKELGLEEKVIFAKHMDTAPLVQLYNSCEVFVFPSLYEGFGLPVLEALQCGACVVASDTSSLKELFGDCCYLVQPQDASSIAAGIERVLSDRTLSDELKARGKARAAEFSWEKAANDTLAVYNALTDKR